MAWDIVIRRSSMRLSSTVQIRLLMVTTLLRAAGLRPCALRMDANLTYSIRDALGEYFVLSEQVLF